MARLINSGIPVGRSFEVYAANEPEAAMSARVLASQAGIIAGNLLYVEQVEAGKWEVVLEEVYAVRPDRRCLAVYLTEPSRTLRCARQPGHAGQHWTGLDEPAIQWVDERHPCSCTSIALSGHYRTCEEFHG